MKQKRHLLAIALLMQAWAATGFAMKPLEEPADTAGRYSGVKMQKGEVITEQDFNNPTPRRHRERAVTPGDFQPMATEAPGATVQRAPRPRPSTVPNAALTPARPGVVPLKIAPPPVKKLPGRLMTPPLVVTGDAAGPAKLPAAVTTGALVVTGAAESAPILPATVNTPALAVTGVADMPPALPSSIATPGLTVTGEAP